VTLYNRIGDLIFIILILTITRLVLPDHSKMLIWIIFICILSRSNLIYHSLNLEIHSFFIIFLAIFYGPWVCVYVAIMSTWLSNNLSFHIGKYNPILVIMDLVHMIFVGLFASLLTVQNFFIPAIIILIVAELFRETVRFFTFHESHIQYLIMGSLFMTMAYIVLKNLPHLFIKWVGG